MQILFWSSSVMILFAIVLFLQSFINVYYRNYNGGPSSSSGSVKYYLFGSIAIFLTGSLLYLFDKKGLATLVMCVPIFATLGYLVIRLFIPLLLREKFN